MKTIILYIILVDLGVGFALLQPCYSQKWGGEGHIAPQTTWIVNVNGGLTSYYGDLSLKSPEVWAKIDKETGPAASIILTRNIYRDAIGLSGQVLAGNLKGNKENISFTTQLLEFNLQARIDFINLILPLKYHAFGVVGYAGAGKFYFSVKNTMTDEGFVHTSNYEARVPEFVYFFGAGIYYKLNPNFGITADFALRQSQNDRLDGLVMNGNNDFYTYGSIGIGYYLKSTNRFPLKNKARIANSNFIFRSRSRITKL